MHPTSRSRHRRRLLGLAVAGLAASGAVRAWGSRNDLVGSGKPVSERRAASGYRAVHLKADIQVVLQPALPEGVELRGDDNLVAAIEVRVTEDAGSPRTLELRWRDGIGARRERAVTAIVGGADLRAVAVSGAGHVEGSGLAGASLALAVAGSGQIELKALKQGEVSAKVAGSGEIELEGRATSFSASIAGSGDLDAAKLEAETVAVKISGSGDASVNASRSLAISIAGSGDVKHRGAAEPQVSVAGSGKVRRI